MRAGWLVIAAIAACSSAQRAHEREASSSIPRTAPAEGSAVERGTLARSPEPLMLAVIAPVNADIAALEKIARKGAADAGVAIEVARQRVEELELTRDSAAYMFGDAAVRDFDAIHRGSALMLTVEDSAGFTSYRALATVAATLSASVRGWVLDPAIGGLFTADAFQARVPGETPDARTLLVVHAVGGDEVQPYLDTLGMARLGLPDLYVAEAAPSQVDQLTRLINATAQTLVIRRDISRPGELDVDLTALDASWPVDDVRANGGTGRLTWKVRWARGRDHGDAAGLVIELTPMEGTGVEGLEIALDGFFGKPTDPITMMPADDPELLAAAERARKELGEMRSRFAKGVPVGEQLSVKTKFTSESGESEWMWVDVVRWRGDELSGTLDNDPQYVTSLRAGAAVTVKLSEVADYFHVLPDGITHGGHSIEILRRRAGP